MNPTGIVLINKPAGITSFDVIRIVRKYTGIRKIGHTGTLDPFASGLLILCIGKATRIAGKLSGKNKEYDVTMKLGISTDTGDSTGKIIRETELPDPGKIDFDRLKDSVIALQKQRPPRFSALKINGKRAYKLARENIDFVIEERPIKIHQFEVIDFSLPYLRFRTVVSKGTYIRSLVETIAEMLDSAGFTWQLVRTGIDNFDLTSAVELDDLKEEIWQKHLIPLNRVFPDMDRVILNPLQNTKFCQGQILTLEHSDADEIMITDENNNCLGFGRISESNLYPEMVLR